MKKVYKLNVSVTLEVFFGLEKEAASLHGGNRKGTYPRLNSIMKFCPPPVIAAHTSDIEGLVCPATTDSVKSKH